MLFRVVALNCGGEDKRGGGEKKGNTFLKKNGQQRVGKGHGKEGDTTVRSASRRLALNSCKIFLKNLEFEGYDYLYLQSC